LLASSYPLPLHSFPTRRSSDLNWLTSSFLIGTLILTLSAVPLYLYHFGLDWFQVALFFAMLWACGFSITIGYHRLFSHLTFQARDRKSTRLNSSHQIISYAVFC